MTERPRLALTMGDVAGIGPEIIARAVSEGALAAVCRPIVVGHPELLHRAAQLIGCELDFAVVDDPASAPSDRVACWNPGGADVLTVEPGRIQAAAGKAAYEYLAAATRAALAGTVDALVTAPLHKEALRLAGVKHPGHTEILAEECGVRESAMMLYLPAGSAVHGPHGLGVAHVTLHTSIHSVPSLLTTPKIADTIRLLDGFLRRLCVGWAVPTTDSFRVRGGHSPPYTEGTTINLPRIGVCALNPHAGEHGLFGDEEARLIEPAVNEARAAGINVFGPIPADALLRRAVAGEFDGVVAMYHDQGHIALKLIGWDQAVNVTLGLPIVRTSPSHGTAFDIAWQGRARADGFLAAAHVACQLIESESRSRQR
jgi:4-hydroxythreonine-4-phosphate dehydrogenase